MATTDALVGSDLQDDLDYRPLSIGAIASAIFGVLSGMLFVAARIDLQTTLAFAPLPVLGLILGISALRKIASMPEQFSGRGPAVAGVILSSIGLLGGLGYAGVVHATEVPEGYTRTSFYEFRPDEVEQRGGKVVPPDIQDLEGKDVFIKGYMRPGTHVSKSGTPVRNNVSRFLLVRDNNQCCFGDISTVKYYDQVLVELEGNLSTSYSGGLFRVGGKLVVNPESFRRMGQTVYALKANYVK